MKKWRRHIEGYNPQSIGGVLGFGSDMAETGELSPDDFEAILDKWRRSHKRLDVRLISGMFLGKIRLASSAHEKISIMRDPFRSSPKVVAAYIDPFYTSDAWYSLHDAVILRDSGVCFYCGSSDGVMADHVIPRRKGGPDHISNLVACCPDCNNLVRSRTFPNKQLKKEWILANRG